MVKASSAEEQLPLPAVGDVFEPNMDHLMSNLAEIESFPSENSSSMGAPTVPLNTFTPGDLISLGLFEQLPSSQLIDDL
jgi:hypothetical protein